MTPLHLIVLKYHVTTPLPHFRTIARPGQLTPSPPQTHSLLSTQAVQTQNNKIGLPNLQATKTLRITRATLGEAQTTQYITCHTSPTLGL